MLKTHLDNGLGKGAHHDVGHAGVFSAPISAQHIHTAVTNRCDKDGALEAGKNSIRKSKIRGARLGDARDSKREHHREGKHGVVEKETHALFFLEVARLFHE